MHPADIVIRPARPADRAAIGALLADAFGGPGEAALVDRLVADGDAVVELVAEDAKGIAAHVLFSAMGAPFPALALAPLATRADRRREGIGAALVRAALQALPAETRAVFVLGDPAYYSRFGFSIEAARGFSSPYAGDHFMALAIGGPLEPRAGELVHASAFAALE